ncbi:MAG TPA: DUF58 domain-containing protein, partial [Jatrophihabitantaceae bacterium]|nr:DUF58 domain-containing protein [Jatrophihabitantaceae bacterium]
MLITGRLVALAALGLALAWASAAVAVWYAVALVLLVAVDVLLAARLAGIRIERAPSRPVRLGERTPSVLHLTNTGRRTLRGVVRDAWVPSAGVEPRAQPVLIRPGARTALTSTLVPTRRGERAAVEVTLRGYGPVGVAGRQRRFAVAGTVHVLPRFDSRRFLPEKLSRLRRLDGAVLVRQRGRGSEFDSLRSYVIGDDVRSIDWRASARSRDVVVRTWRPERDRTLVL